MTTKLDSTMQDIFVECCRSVEMTAKVFFPERFHRPFSSGHKQIFAAIDDPSIRKLLIKAPRGFGKTSILQLASNARDLLFQTTNYIVPISKTQDIAVQQAENLKRELQQNELIREFFPDLKTKNWSKEGWETSTGCLVVPRGANQQVRGQLYKNFRPNRIILDDIEGKKEVQNDRLRAELKTWVMTDVMNSVDRGAKDWKITVIGTVLHQDSLIEHLAADPAWTTISIELFDDDYKSQWPDFMSDEDVAAMVKEYRDSNRLDELWQEYRNIPISKEGASFQAEHFRYYREEELTSAQRRQMSTMVIVDPAKTTGPESCETAIVAVGFNPIERRLYIREIIAGHFNPHDQASLAISLAKKLGAIVLAVEKTGLDEYITYPFRTMMIKEGAAFTLVELKARGDKLDRISGLIPFYRQGMVYHNPDQCTKLESQLLMYPKSKMQDVMDATSYCVQVLDQAAAFFNGDALSFQHLEERYAELAAGYDEPLKYRS